MIGNRSTLKVMELIKCDESSLNVIGVLSNAIVMMRNDPGEELILMKCA